MLNLYILVGSVHWIDQDVDGTKIFECIFRCANGRHIKIIHINDLNVSFDGYVQRYFAVAQFQQATKLFLAYFQNKRMHIKSPVCLSVFLSVCVSFWVSPHK
jgi:hypothetical protein